MPKIKVEYYKRQLEKYLEKFEIIQKKQVFNSEFHELMVVITSL